MEPGRFVVGAIVFLVFAMAGISMAESARRRWDAAPDDIAGRRRAAGVWCAATSALLVAIVAPVVILTG